MVVKFVSTVPVVTGMGPEPGILVSVTLEALQFRGLSKVATRAWIGHGFGLRPAADPQL